MSMIRKTVLTTAIVGAGLASTTGAAFAGDCPTDSGHGHHSKHSSHEKSEGSAKGCSNLAKGDIDNGGAKTLIGVLDGSQGALGLNLCDNLNGNQILSNNNFSLLGNIHNGDTTEKTESAALGTGAASGVAPAPSGVATTPIQG